MLIHALVICTTMVQLSFSTSPVSEPPPVPERSSCPHDKSFDGFDMQKMLGKWHVAEISTTIPPGGRELVKPIQGQTITIRDESGVYHLTHSVGKTHPFVHKYQIVDEDPKVNSREIQLAVVATDYDNVALVITCEQSFTAARVARVLLRGNSESDRKFVDRMHDILPERGFTVQDMEKVGL